MNIEIAHKHAGHLIVVQGKPFKANDSGMWNLTEIWQALRLPKAKQPGKFVDRKEAQRFLETGKIGSERKGSLNQTFAAKQAVIRYAAWVSSEFEDVVYDAFEAILDMPDVALLVAGKMSELGRVKESEILRRIAESDKSARQVALRHLNRGRVRRALSPQEKEVQTLSRHAARFEKKLRG